MSESSPTLKVSYIRALSDKVHAQSLNDTWLNIHPDFQREYDQRPIAWVNSLVESIFMNRMMPPVWTVYNKEKDCDEVLDGQHRLRTILDFVDNKIPGYHKKMFRDLDRDEQQKVLNYQITLNKLPSSYRESPSELFKMYEILNRASKPLNKYEVYKPLRLEFYKIITNKLRRFYETPLFPETQEKNYRGACEMRIIQIMAIHDIDFDRSLSWQSMEDHKEKWCSLHMGDNDEEIRQNIQQNRERIEGLMDLLYNSMDHFKQLDFFHNGDKCIVDKHNSLIFQVVLARSVKIFGKDRRKYRAIIEFVKQEVLPDISKYTGRDGRDTQFQKKMMKKINTDLCNIYDQSESARYPRLFKKEDILHKLEEQKHICPLCNNRIEEHHTYHGDHIQPYAKEGLTTMSNLRVVHKTCHQALP